jgi:hypothetical protein
MRQGVDAQRGRLMYGPFERRQAVEVGRREAMLRPHPVVDGYHHHAGLGAQAAAQHVVGVEVTDGPAAAVVIHQRGECRSAAGRGLVLPHHEAGAVGADLVVGHGTDFGRVGLTETASGAIGYAGLLGGLGVHRWDAVVFHQFEQDGGLRIEHDGLHVWVNNPRIPHALSRG